MGAELAQRGSDHSWKPLAFFSHKLTDTERKYSAFDRELLAIYLSVRHYKHFLEGKHFVIFTDHKPLIYVFTSSTDNRSPRQTRHLSYVSELSTDVRHIKGERNVVADTLSRPSTSTPSPLTFPGSVPLVASVAFPDVPSMDYGAFAEAQDPGDLLESSSLKLSKVKFRDYVLWCDSSGGRTHPLVLVQFCRRIFDALHGLSHPGMRPTLKMISTRYVWPGLRKQVREWCRTCLPCQTSKVCLLYTSPSPRDS